MNRMIYPIIELSWEKKYLKNRSFPQSVKITTPGFLETIKKLLYDYDDTGVSPYFQRLRSFLEREDRLLTGVMDYKTPLDWMGVYYFSWGMVSCINEKVKTILENNAAETEFLLKQISIKGVDEPYYVLFVFMLSFEEAGVVFSNSEYEVVDRNSSDYGRLIHLTDSDEYRQHQLDFVPRKLCINPPGKRRGIYFIESCSQLFYSPEIAEAFAVNHISGASVLSPKAGCLEVLLA